MILTKNIRKVHIVGIGGISMSAIAKLLIHRGYACTGSDKVKNDNTDEVERLGAKIFIGHEASNITDQDLLVYTAAVDENIPEIKRAKELGIPVYGRAAFLGELMAEFENSVAVSGAHGKTTTTSMLTHVLKDRLTPTVLVGGLLAGEHSNILIGHGNAFIHEACEFKDTFLSLRPKTSVILNIDEDHLEYFKNLDNIVKSFAQFITQTTGTCVYNVDDENVRRAVELAKKVASGTQGSANPIYPSGAQGSQDPNNPSGAQGSVNLTYPSGAQGSVNPTYSYEKTIKNTPENGTLSNHDKPDCVRPLRLSQGINSTIQGYSIGKTEENPNYSYEKPMSEKDCNGAFTTSDSENSKTAQNIKENNQDYSHQKADILHKRIDSLHQKADCSHKKTGILLPHFKTFGTSPEADYRAVALERTDDARAKFTVLRKYSLNKGTNQSLQQTQIDERHSSKVPANESHSATKTPINENNSAIKASNIKASNIKASKNDSYLVKTSINETRLASSATSDGRCSEKASADERSLAKVPANKSHSTITPAKENQKNFCATPSGRELDFSYGEGYVILAHVELSAYDFINWQNALATFAASMELLCGDSVVIDDNYLETASWVAEKLGSFKNADRRFQVLGTFKGITVVDDFAHHPNEIKNAVSTAVSYFNKSVKAPQSDDNAFNQHDKSLKQDSDNTEQGGQKKLVALFQPYTFSRTKLLLDEFGTCFKGVDVLVVSDILGGREVDPGDISASDVVRVARENGIDAIEGGSLEESGDKALEILKSGGLVMTVGCGNVYLAARYMRDKLK